MYVHRRSVFHYLIRRHQLWTCVWTHSSVLVHLSSTHLLDSGIRFYWLENQLVLWKDVIVYCKIIWWLQISPNIKSFSIRDALSSYSVNLIRFKWQQRVICYEVKFFVTSDVYIIFEPLVTFYCIFFTIFFHPLILCY